MLHHVIFDWCLKFQHNIAVSSSRVNMFDSWACLPLKILPTGTNHHVIWCYIPEERRPQLYCCRSLKTHICYHSCECTRILHLPCCVVGFPSDELDLPHCRKQLECVCSVVVMCVCPFKVDTVFQSRWRLPFGACGEGVQLC